MEALTMFPLLGGLLSGAMGMFGQQDTNRMQAQMMQQQQGFQERMSSTAYQRSYADMMAAGLNPMMMFSSGSAASSPAGAPASAAVKSGFDADAVQKAVNSAVQLKVSEATVDNLVKQNAKIIAETKTEQERGVRTAHEADTAAVETLLRRLNIPMSESRNKILNNEAITAVNEAKMTPTARRLLDQAGYGGRKGSEGLSPITDVISSAKSARSLLPSTRESVRSTTEWRNGPHFNKTDTFKERFGGYQ